jgi:hypothetical protein
MTISARGVAIFSGILLSGFGLLGLFVSHTAPADSYYLIASWPLPIALFPAAALAAALDGDALPSVSGQARVLWPAYVGLVMYAGVAGGRWLEASGRGTHENYAGLFLLAVMALHAAVFLISGAIFALFPKTRPAGFQIWLAYPLLLACWLLGGFVL